MLKRLNHVKPKVNTHRRYLPPVHPLELLQRQYAVSDDLFNVIVVCVVEEPFKEQWNLK